jgi:hypothetical protein
MYHIAHKIFFLPLPAGSRAGGENEEYCAASGQPQSPRHEGIFFTLVFFKNEQFVNFLLSFLLLEVSSKTSPMQDLRVNL